MIDPPVSMTTDHLAIGGIAGAFLVWLARLLVGHALDMLVVGVRQLNQRHDLILVELAALREEVAYLRGRVGGDHATGA